MNDHIKIGILIPKSQQYPTLDKDFIRGIKLNNLNVKFFVESIGIGADEKIIIDKIQKLNFQEEVSIIIGFFGHNNMDQVYEYASKNDVLLIASDLGATIPYGSIAHKGVYINSLGLTESCYHLGHYLTTKNYKKIATSTSYYDSGYGMLSAIEHAFHNDTNFSGHYITPFIPREDEAVHMNQSISIQEPDAVFAFYSGLYAEENAAFINQNKIIQKYPFYVTPFFINDKILEEYKNNPHELYVVGSWMQDDSQSVDFDTEYKNTYSESPSAFSILGYESGLLLKNILNNTNDNPKIDVLINEINKLNITGPRGTIQFDADTNRTIFDHYIYKLNIDSLSNLSFIKIETLANDGHFIKAITSYNEPVKFGGWQNAYLCH
ncbi:ABC transporter substrate-binding protein [Flavobacterium sp. MC2016-06]|uniref:ABC transporter substrate-binding protein n=1 Tax=Flavobacterium sp. MC2016-06 TaxID=2676308 RepID=UPI0012BAF112|nr:ABC transporter substrate-binding protein [Flavobacterium sp. MC2016-06]MBU3862215.1 ABC transporter substrate-binding protein [Flavobacterium sp. MC2016-06]